MRSVRTHLIGGLVLMLALVATGDSYADAPPGMQSIAFIYNYNSRQLSDLHIPGTEQAFPFAINDNGDVVGSFPHNGCFRFTGGHVVTIVPDQGAQKCSPRGINDSGSVVGWYLSATSAQGGFLLRGDTITSIALDGCFSTTPNAINNAGQIVGTCSHAGPPAPGQPSDFGFIMEANGTSTTFSVPGATSVSAVGIDGAGDVVGFAYFAGGSKSSFVYSHGSSRMLNASACDSVQVTGISNRGRIVGFCIPPGASAYAGFIMDSPTSTASLFTGPNGEALMPDGINDEGQVVGTMNR